MSAYEKGRYRGEHVHTEEDHYWQSTPEQVPPLPAWFRKLHKMPALREDADSCVASEAEKQQSPESAF